MVWSLISIQVGDCCYMEPNRTQRLNFHYFYWHNFPHDLFDIPKVLYGGLGAAPPRQGQGVAPLQGPRAMPLVHSLLRNRVGSRGNTPETSHSFLLFYKGVGSYFSIGRHKRNPIL
jgi:hypothetical protein